VIQCTDCPAVGVTRIAGLTIAAPSQPGLVSSFTWIIGFSPAGHPLPTRPEPAWQKMAQSPLNGTTRLVDIGEEGLIPARVRRCLKKKKLDEATLGFMEIRDCF